MKTFRLTLALCALLALPLALAQVTLRLGHHHAVGGTLDLTAEKFSELVTAKTGGSVQIRIFPAAQLGQEIEMLDLIDQGVVDISLNTLGPVNRFWAPTGTIMLPFVWQDWDHLYRAFDGELGAAIAEGVAANSKIEVIGYLHVGFRHLLFRDGPVTTLAQLQGLRMRSPEDRTFIRMFELLGTRPTPVTWGEVYTAMQTGVAAGLDSPLQAALDMKFNEVIKAVVLTNHMFSTAAFLMNEGSLGRLTAEQQAAVRAAAVEAADWQNRTISQPAEVTAIAALEASGVQVVPPTDPQEWATAMEPLWAETVGTNAESQRVLDLILAARR